jgi:RsiW-degrading membrane proteinase PrsW (M82 family)
MQHSQLIIIALLGGILPALVWLFFWLREDSKKPEPRGYIALTFFAGMLTVPLVVPFQKFAYDIFVNYPTILYLALATLEELIKYGAAYVIALKRKVTNEPIDAVVYMMTAAIGFSALENALFLLDPISSGNIIGSLQTGNSRFIGASLLHTLSSAIVGIAIALSFYKSKLQKKVYLLWGLVTAIALHTIFNLLIIQGQNGTTFATFGFVWIALVIVMLFFEKVKQVFPVNTP